MARSSVNDSIPQMEEKSQNLSYSIRIKGNKKKGRFGCDPGTKNNEQ